MVHTVLATTGEVVATLDRRYQSYNIEMVEVTGGEFWKPYDAGPGKVVRPPIDLGSERLRMLARALGPAYIRVSGTWANWTYFDAGDDTAGACPDGFDGVLTREQWRGVADFADAVDGEVVTSFAVSDGIRGPDGAWRDEQARALLAFSKDIAMPLAAAEFCNEPSLPMGFPASYDATAYRRDFETFAATAAAVMPELALVGPGMIGDDGVLGFQPVIAAEDMLEDTADKLDVFSYHFYPKLSERCGSTAGAEIALDPEFLARVGVARDHHRGLRDRYLPAAPTWVTETAQAACGGDRWAAAFRDVIRHVDTLGRLATDDGAVVFHNTLAASDYGLLDEIGFTPRPNYWAALLWQRLMGTEVLALDPATAAAAAASGLTVYAHRTPGEEAHDVTYAVVNASPSESHTVTTDGGDATVYLLTSDDLDSGTVALNGTVVHLGAGDTTLPPLEGAPAGGPITVAPASVAFVVGG
ncbi:MAG: hypothetical protein K1X95_14320 [Acidimicrobiia bacterium]|nr:hypothetical protein [Acidimicrobiia bacterium]